MIEFDLTVPIPRHLTSAARLNFAIDISYILEVHEMQVTSQARSVVDSNGEVSSKWNGVCAVQSLIPFTLDMELVLADWAASKPAVLYAQGERRLIERDDRRLDTDRALTIREHLKGGSL